MGIYESLRGEPQAFGWPYVAFGIWLVLSPFWLLSQEALSDSLGQRMTAISMYLGFIVLVISGVNIRRHRYVGIVLKLGGGIAVSVAPVALGFAFGSLLTWSIQLTGAALVSLVIWEVVASGPEALS